MKKSTFYGFAILAIIVVAGFMLIKGGEASVTGNVVNVGNGDVQEIVLGMKNYNYYPNSVTVNAGSPVRISLDSSVYGCFRDFTLRDFGIHKYLESPEDYVEFVPDKPGIHTFACSMGMGTGKLIVR